MKTSSDIKSNLTMPISERTKLPRAYYALLAKVGHHKRKVSTYQDEVEFYYGIATELLATLGEAVELLQEVADKDPSLKKSVSHLTSKQHSSIKQLLGFWPNDSESQKRIWDLLESDGLEKVMGLTPDGYTCLSSDLTLDNVERIFAAIRERPPSP